MHAHTDHARTRRHARQGGAVQRPNPVVLPPAETAAGTDLALQRALGNAALARALAGDRHVHGADCGHQQPAPVQRSAVHDVLRGVGRPLDATVREDMEARFQTDFSDVRLHTDAAARRSAAELGARAYTSGHHVVIGEGGADRHTLAHELTHVIQQRKGPVAGTATADGLSVSDPSDAFEREAEARATQVLRGPSPAHAGEAASSGAPSGQVQRAPGPRDTALQRATIDEAPTTWQAQPVRRSEHGADGVYFVGPPGRQVVVKPLMATGNVAYADRFLAEMGISAPRSVTHAVASPEGQALSRLLHGHASGGGNREEITQQLDRATGFLVMEMVSGTALHVLPDDDAQKYLHDTSALHQTGRLMAFDTFLGNGDRFLTKINLGNLLYQSPGEDTPGGIHAIDNDSKFPAPAVGERRDGTKQLDNDLQGKVEYFDMLSALDKEKHFIVDRFLGRFGTAHHKHPQVSATLKDSEQHENIRSALKRGIASGLSDLATTFKERTDLIKAMGAGYDRASAHNRSVSSGKAAAKYVYDTQQGVTPEQARQQLIAYVEHRVKKEKIPSGFQWVSKFI
ncbi:eCIS core domain-containing protein [Streptomyces cellulosae]|uniref:eCIS core domain-containing protein n=1 Tax=Streptomyces cellulosae TaxID=1968 RepID=UPI0006892F6D|nr:DUF4157 domain-containing protein [Streptomyces cellulosae]